MGVVVGVVVVVCEVCVCCSTFDIIAVFVCMFVAVVFVIVFLLSCVSVLEHICMCVSVCVAFPLSFFFFRCIISPHSFLFSCRLCTLHGTLLCIFVVYCRDLIAWACHVLKLMYLHLLTFFLYPAFCIFVARVCCLCVAPA